jgi:hypothetical protein
MVTPAQQHAIWEAMADHFLDSETRPWIPRTALLCVEAGLTIDEAGAIWRFEVTPVVFANLWSVAGEWGAWDTDWLFARIEQVRASWMRRPGWLRRLVYCLCIKDNHYAWMGIERVMELLAATPSSERALLARHLEWLAEPFVGLRSSVGSPPARLELLRHRYEHVFLPIFGSLISGRGEESLACSRARVEAALTEAFSRAAGRPCCR